ncbi:MAG TPA: ArsA family ATPase [Gemmatimonadaceae bacterium]|nr:ArsA family ATPase [Gemmatimonadaceae bacterium]
MTGPAPGAGAPGAGAPGASAFQQLIDRLPPFTLVVGKGGVGKTTLAVGIASGFAQRGSRTLLLSTDPAGTLASALNVELPAHGAAGTIPNRPRLRARQLSAADAREEFLTRWRDVLVDIVDRGTYLDHSDVQGLVDAALPGADEIFALLVLAGLVSSPSSDEHDRLVVDTAPTGHTLRLLQLPETFSALLALLDAMQEKHRFMVRALTHRYRGDRADAFLAEMRAAVDALRGILADRTRCAALLVARAEPVVEAETARYAAALQELGITRAALVVNAVPDLEHGGEPQLLHRLQSIAPDALHLVLPGLDEPPAGLGAIDAAMTRLLVLPGPAAASSRASSRAMRAAEKGWGQGQGGAVSWFSGGAPQPSHARVDPALVASLLRTLTFVAGKGGVGKTTVSCALAIAAAVVARAGERILLVSTDPAPSIADAIDQPLGDSETSIAAVPRLIARQMDATAAFRELRDRYRARIDALFEGFVARGVDAAYDRAILRDLLALAPPGIDELYALTFLGEAVADARFHRIIVDPAPTGHLLRLLEMPALALDWSHRLMRLVLKYREIIGPGDAAEELLAFARRTRALQELLLDPTRAGVILVALDEPLVRGESERLAAALQSASVHVLGIAWNRVADTASDHVAPLPVAAPVPQLLAPAADAPLVGADAIRAWLARWRLLGQR